MLFIFLSYYNIIKVIQSYISMKYVSKINIYTRVHISYVLLIFKMRGGNAKRTFIKIDIPIQIKPRFLRKKC